MVTSPYVIAIDDNPDLLGLYQDICADEGFGFSGFVHEAWDGAILATVPFRLLIVDPEQPTGELTWEWMATVADWPSPLTIALVSGRLSESTDRLLEAVAGRNVRVTTLRKPFELDDLLHIFHQAHMGAAEHQGGTHPALGAEGDRPTPQERSDARSSQSPSPASFS
jgi:DNA-binding response OmpR family regulator